MAKCFWVLNHGITEGQQKDLIENYGVREISSLPPEMAEVWGNLPLEPFVDDSIIASLLEWLSCACSEDVIVVQGEPVYSFSLVNALLQKNIRVLAAVTARISTQKQVGDSIVKESVFKHVCFRQYKIN